MSDEYVVIAWAACSFVAGLGVGGYVVNTLTRGASAGARLVTRRGFEWARRDISAQAPATRDTFVRLVTPGPTPSIDDEGQTLTFAIHDHRSGLDRDMSFTVAQINRFMKCDTPSRSEWHGANGDYSKLLMVARHYGWCVAETNRYQWATFLSTRERRVRALEMWASK